MSWTTNGSGKTATAVNTTTGAHTMRQHREIKRQQAEARNAATRPKRRRLYRRSVEYRNEVWQNEQVEVDLTRATGAESYFDTRAADSPEYQQALDAARADLLV